MMLPYWAGKDCHINTYKCTVFTFLMNKHIIFDNKYVNWDRIYLYSAYVTSHYNSRNAKLLFTCVFIVHSCPLQYGGSINIPFISQCNINHLKPLTTSQEGCWINISNHQNLMSKRTRCVHLIDLCKKLCIG